MTEKGCIYLITNIITNRRYVGLTKYPTPDKRYKQHWNVARYNPKTPLYQDMIKYGKTAFTLETLCSANIDKLEIMEEYWAEQLETYISVKSQFFPRGYNVKQCGSYSDPNSHGQLTDALKGRKALPHVLAAMRANWRHVWKGRKHKAEACKKIGDAHRGLIASDETRAKMAIAHTGKIQSDEHNQKARDNRLKSIIENGAKGVKLSKHDILSIVAQVNSGKTQTNVAKEYNVQISVISRIMSGDRWSFVTGIEPKQHNTRNHVKLGIETANEIRSLYASGDYTYKGLAEKYSVNRTTIANIVNFKLYNY